MKIIRKAMLMSIFLFLAMGCETHAATRWNVFLMGDSIIDNYPHTAKGLYEYMSTDDKFVIRCDYSYEGSIICRDMPGQYKKVAKRLELKKNNSNNVLICSWGTNDHFKKCECENHMLTCKKYIKKLKMVCPKLKIIFIVPDHILKVRDNAELRSIYRYPYKNAWMVDNVKVIRTSKIFASTDIQRDCLHPTKYGYQKLVKEIKKILGV